jgi:hypothetical protein
MQWKTNLSSKQKIVIKTYRNGTLTCTEETVETFRDRNTVLENQLKEIEANVPSSILIEGTCKPQKQYRYKNGNMYLTTWDYMVGTCKDFDARITGISQDKLTYEYYSYETIGDENRNKDRNEKTVLLGTATFTEIDNRECTLYINEVTEGYLHKSREYEYTTKGRKYTYNYVCGEHQFKQESLTTEPNDITSEVFDM